MSDADSKPSFRLSPWIKDILLPIVIAFGTTMLTLSFNERHNISISIIPADDAKPVESELRSEPRVVSPQLFVAEPPRFTYTVIIRNDGDFSEENLTVSIGFAGDERSTLVAGPDVNYSSTLLGKTVMQISPEPGDNYGFSTVRLNPGEWISLQNSWSWPMDVRVQARSDTVFSSAFEERIDFPESELLHNANALHS